MDVVHRWLGAAVVVGFALLMLWGLGVWLLRRRTRGREPGAGFYRLLSILQVTVGLQVVAGLILGIIRGFGDQPLLHYFYGGVFPILVLTVAHVIARGMEEDRWVPFPWAGLICFGLTLRALETGCVDLTFLDSCFGF